MLNGTSLAVCLLALAASGGGGAELMRIERPRGGRNEDDGIFDAPLPPSPRFEPMPPPGPRQDRWRRRQQAEAAGILPAPREEVRAAPEKKAKRKAQRKARRGNR